MTNLSTRERRQEKTRQAILSTAMQIITEKGSDKLSLREIARRIDYSPAGLYEYFDSKDDIIQTLCEIGNDRLLTYLKGVPTDLPLREYVIQLAQAYVDFAHQNPEQYLFQFTYRQPEFVENATLPAEEFHSDDAFTILYDAIVRGIQSGLIEIEDESEIIQIAYGIWAWGHGTAMLQLRNLRHFDYDFQQADRFMIEKIVSAIIKEES